MTFNSNVKYINNTICYNNAKKGGAIRFNLENTGTIFWNNIIWGNTATEEGDQVYIDDLDCQPEFYNCNIEGKKDNFEVGSSEPKHMVSLLLQRKRELSGLSLAQVASRLSMKSRNTYARYEQGNSVPSVEKLNELLNAVCPQTDIVINESSIPLRNT